MKTPEELQAEIEALKAQNATLIGEKRSATTKATEAETARIAAEEAAQAEKNKAATAAAKAAGDLTALEKSLNEKFEAELAKKDGEIKTLKDENAKIGAARDKLVLDNGLSEALDKAGVSAELKPAVLAMHRAANKTAVEIDGDGNFVGKIGDKPIASFVDEWAKSDAAKPFLPNGNSGGGGQGNNSGGGKSKDNPYLKESLNKTRQGQLEATDRGLANKYRAEAGLPALA